MIHEAYMPVYMGPRFSLPTGPPEVVHEALADLKKLVFSCHARDRKMDKNISLSGRALDDSDDSDDAAIAMMLIGLR